MYGPIEVANNIRILEGGKFYVEFNGKKLSSWIYDPSTNQKISFDGALANGGDFSKII